MAIFTMKTSRDIMQSCVVVLATLVVFGIAQDSTVYDVAIAGGGTAGLYLAIRLAQLQPNAKILVLEAGKSCADDPRALVPENEGSLVGTMFDWNFTTVPQRGLYQNATQSVPRGKTLGGSAALNYLIFARPSKVELDAYENVLGLNGLDWDNLLPAFEATERFADPGVQYESLLSVDDSVHGRAGLIGDSMVKAPYTLYTDYVMPALRNLGVLRPEDRTAGVTAGYGFVPLSVDNATYQRSWSGSSYANLAASLANLEVITGASVTRTIWGNDQTERDLIATGFDYLNASGAMSTASARTVVLSAGAVQSPQLLELSGIGDASRLKKLAINPLIDLLGVGEQATDHLTYAGSFGFNVSDFANGQYVQDFQDYATPSRFLSTEDHDFINSLLEDDINRPSVTTNTTWQMFKTLWAADDSFIEYGWYYGFVNTYLLHPLSQGSIHAASADPDQPPAIDTGYNSAVTILANGTLFQWDLWLLAKAVQYYAAVLPLVPPLSKIDASFSLDASLPFDQIQEKVFTGLGTGSHQSGGAVMLPQEAGGVVDTDFKVYGTQNVYVVDAAVLPVVPGQHIMGMIYALAERAAAVLATAHL